MSSSVPSEDELEVQYHKFICRAFRSYRQWHLSVNNKRRYDYNERLSERHKALLSEYPSQLTLIDNAIANNADFLETMIDLTQGFLLEEEGGNSHNNNDDDHEDSTMTSSTEAEASNHQRKPTGEDMSKICSTLRQLVREWSADGTEEREKCFKPILDELQRRYPPEVRSKTRILVPGAGLGRLTWEIARLGFQCEGNEFSLYMVFVSNFIMNYCNDKDVHTIHPWTHTFSNVQSMTNVIKQVSVPDVNPNTLPDSGSLSMSAGDFIEAYKDNPLRWDCIITCFFLDTAKSVPDYLDSIYQNLRDDGLWINLGPTLWHWETSSHDSEDISIELTVEDLKNICRKMGWQITNEKEITTTYAAMTSGSLFSPTYHAIFWLATKLIPPTDDMSKFLPHNVSESN